MAYTTIDDGSAHFQTVIWTGNDSNPRTISHGGNSDMQPDWLWHKLRSGILSHMMYDSTRGVGKRLHPDQNAAEISQEDTGTITAFTSDGFTVDEGTSNDLYVNDGSRTYVSWGWKANGGTTTSVSASGSGATQIVASTHQANTEAGFSIVTFTAPSIGSGNDFTVSHGLGGVAEMIILKRRNGTGNWHVYHKGTGNLGATFLNLDNAFTDAEYFGDTDPTSTVFSQSEGSATDPGHTLIAYCFKSIQGYSKIGSYIGNGNASHSPFIYTGFKPAWVIVKGTSSSREWFIFDGTRDPINPFAKYVKAESTDAEATSAFGDFCSNGFKIRSDGASYNANAQTFIYMAFAEHPFVSSEGVPVTAK